MLGRVVLKPGVVGRYAAGSRCELMSSGHSIAGLAHLADAVPVTKHHKGRGIRKVGLIGNSPYQQELQKGLPAQAPQAMSEVGRRSSRSRTWD